MLRGGAPLDGSVEYELVDSCLQVDELGSSIEVVLGAGRPEVIGLRTQVLEGDTSGRIHRRSAPRARALRVYRGVADRTIEEIGALCRRGAREDLRLDVGGGARFPPRLDHRLD